MQKKNPQDSYSEQVQVLNQSTMNGNNRLFGGHLMEWIDLVGVVVARRHSHCNVTTLLVDNLEFKAPAEANNLIVLAGQVVFTGTTSMEIRVKTFIEALDGTRTLINMAYLTLVALDENNRPCPVPQLVPQTDEEKDEWEKAKLRRDFRNKMRNR